MKPLVKAFVVSGAAIASVALPQMAFAREGAAGNRVWECTEGVFVEGVATSSFCPSGDKPCRVLINSVFYSPDEDTKETVHIKYRQGAAFISDRKEASLLCEDGIALQMRRVSLRREESMRHKIRAQTEEQESKQYLLFVGHVSDGQTVALIGAPSFGLASTKIVVVKKDTKRTMLPDSVFTSNREGIVTVMSGGDALRYYKDGSGAVYNDKPVRFLSDEKARAFAEKNEFFPKDGMLTQDVVSLQSICPALK